MILSFTKIKYNSILQIIFRGTYWLRFWAQLQRDEHNKNLLSSLSTKLEMVSLEQANGGWKHSPHYCRQSSTRLRRSLPAAALLFSSPTAPCVTTVTRTRLLACGRTSDQPKDGWRGSVDIVPGHDDEPAGHLRPRAAVDPAPPTITRTTTSFATEVRPAWTPNALSLIGHQNRSAIYSCQCGLIRETWLDNSSLFDWLWFWLMDFVAPSLCK
jgi:hypothetical protein